MIKTRFSFQIGYMSVWERFEKVVEMPYRVAVGDEITIEQNSDEGPYQTTVLEQRFDISSMCLIVDLAPIEDDEIDTLGKCRKQMESIGWSCLGR